MHSRGISKGIILILCVIMIGAFSGCGWFEGMYDDANYESLTNETGDIVVFSGGTKLYEYKNAKIKYSSSDTDAVWFTTADGHDKYVQPGLIIHLED